MHIISDVHANLPALDAVLDCIPPGETIICAGDIVGYYTEPNEVCAKLRSRGVWCIKGNHDKYVLGELDYPSDRESKYRVNWTRGVLLSEHRNWLDRLPESLIVDCSLVSSPDHRSRDVHIRVAHGAPNDVSQYVYPNSSLDFLEVIREDFLVLGHTHHPMVRRTEGPTVINPGSVGQPRDRIPGACHAKLVGTDGSVHLYRAQYPIEAYQARLEVAGLDRSMIDILSRRY